MKTIIAAVIAAVLFLMIITCANERMPVITLDHSTLIQNATGSLNIN